MTALSAVASRGRTVGAYRQLLRVINTVRVGLSHAFGPARPRGTHTLFAAVPCGDHAPPCPVLTPPHRARSAAPVVFCLQVFAGDSAAMLQCRVQARQAFDKHAGASADQLGERGLEGGGWIRRVGWLRRGATASRLAVTRVRGAPATPVPSPTHRSSLTATLPAHLIPRTSARRRRSAGRGRGRYGVPRRARGAGEAERAGAVRCVCVGATSRTLGIRRTFKRAFPHSTNRTRPPLRHTFSSPPHCPFPSPAAMKVGQQQQQQAAGGVSGGSGGSGSTHAGGDDKPIQVTPAGAAAAAHGAAPSADGGCCGGGCR